MMQRAGHCLVYREKLALISKEQWKKDVTGDDGNVPLPLRMGGLNCRAALRAAQLQYPPDAAIVLVLGSDQLHNLPTWSRWQTLFELAHLAVTQRERVSLQGLPEAVEAEVSRRGADALPDAPAGGIVFFRMPAVAVSATALRAQLARGERPDGLSPPAVLDYIDSHRLYRRP